MNYELYEIEAEKTLHRPKPRELFNLDKTLPPNYTTYNEGFIKVN